MITFIADPGEILRKALITYVNVGDSETPSWEVVGYKIEESMQEFNPDIETLTDILGVTHSTVNKMETEQSFEPFTIRGDSKLAEKLFNIAVHEKAYQKLSMFEVMNVYGFAGTEGAWAAELQQGCTITPQSLGGSSRVDFPFTIQYSNNSTWGTVDKLTPDFVFTPTAT